MMSPRARLLAAVRSWLPILSGGATIGGGVVKQNAEAAGSTAQANGGLALAVIGLVGMAIHFLDRYANPWFADRREERSLKEKQLRLADIEEKARRAEARAVAAEAQLGDLEREVHDKDHRIADLERLSLQIPVNEAQIAATQGTTEALRETLHAMGKPPAPAPRPNQRRLRPTVLIVEDEPDNAFMLNKLLTMEGIATSFAATMDDAVRLMEFGNPHWLILDLKVQGEDGLDLLRKIRREGLTTHVAIITGASDPARLDEARALQPDGLYSKPLKEQDYRRLIDLILGRATDPAASASPGQP